MINKDEQEIKKSGYQQQIEDEAQQNITPDKELNRKETEQITNPFYSFHPDVKDPIMARPSMDPSTEKTKAKQEKQASNDYQFKHAESPAMLGATAGAAKGKMDVDANKKERDMNIRRSYLADFVNENGEDIINSEQGKAALSKAKSQEEFTKIFRRLAVDAFKASDHYKEVTEQLNYLNLPYEEKERLREEGIKGGIRSQLEELKSSVRSELDGDPRQSDESKEEYRERARAEYIKRHDGKEPTKKELDNYIRIYKRKGTSFRQESIEADKQLEENLDKAQQGNWLQRTLGTDLAARTHAAKMQTHYGLPETSKLEIADKYIRDAEFLINENDKKDGSKLASAGRAFRKEAFNPETWTYGISQYLDEDVLNDISAKFDKGEQLTDAEAKLMDALAINLATNLYFDNPNRGSKWGEIAGQSLPFMVEFMLNPISSGGKGLTQVIGRYGVERFSNKAAQRAMRVGAAMVGDAVSAAGMVGTSGIVNTINGIGERYKGQHTFKVNEDSGAIEYAGREGGESLQSAVTKEVMSQFIQYLSEMSGERFGEVGGLIGLSKPGRGIASAYRASDIGKFFNKMQGSAVYRTLRAAEKKAQWSGTFGQFFEEGYDTVLNSLFVGDEQLSDLIDLDQQIDTFMGLALTGGAMSGIRTAGYAGDRIITGEKLRALTNDIQNYVGNWDAVKAGIDGMTIAERSWLIKALAGGRNEKVFTDAAGRVEGEMSTGEYREMKTQEQNEVRDVLNFINNEILQGEGLAREGQQQDVSYNKIYEGLNDKLSLGARRKLAEYVSRQTYYEAMTSTARERIEQDREKAREQGVDAFNAAVSDKRATSLAKMQAEYEALVNQGLEIQETKNEEGTPINIYDYDGELEKGNITAEEAEVFKNLGDARARMHGAMDQLKKEAQEQVQPLVDFVYEQGTHDSGQVIQVNIGTEEAPKYAFVKKGNLPISEDGNIDYKNADDVVFIVDSDGNQRVMPTNKIRDARAWEKGWMFEQETYANAYDKIVTPLIEKTEGNAKFEDGEKVEYRDKKGDPHVGTVQNQSDNVVTITDEQGKAQTFTNEELDSSLMGEQVAGVQARDEITVYIDGEAYIANVDHVEGGIAMIEVPDAPDAANRFMSVSEEQLMEMMAQPEPSELDKALADEQTDAKDEQREDAKGSEEITKTSEITADNETATPSGENNVIDADVEMTETVPTVELPRTKEGDIDYDNIKDDATFIQALEEDFKDTPQDIPEILEDYRKLAEKKVSNAKKRKDPIQRRKAVREAETEVERWKNLKDAYQQKKLAEQVQQDNSQTLEEAQQREEAARQQRKEEELKAQQEAESVQGVPDMSVDTAEAARNRGFRVQNGIRINRAQPIEAQNATEQTRKFKDGVEVKVKRTIVEANQLHPSHKGGIVNPMHFITEGQPKDRTDEASKAARTSIATNVNPPEITGGVTAYTGAPVANQRGEIIQGNGRTDGLQEMYKGYPDSAARYKQHLADTASDYGMTAEQVQAMNNPVAVDIVDTSDSEAVRLGQYTASDTESGGVQRISPQHAAVGLGENISNFTSILYNSQNEDMSMGEVVDMNGKKALEYLYNKGLLNDTQYQTAFDSKGNLTPEVKADMQAVTAHVLFNGASDNLPRMFKALPDKAQKSILQTIHRDLENEKGDRIIKDVRDAIEAYWHLMQHPEFAEATKYEDLRAIAEQARNQKQMFNSETELPLKKYSNFAMEMAILFKSDTQKGLRQRFNSLFDQLQGKGGSLFEEAVKLPLTEAIKNNFNNIDYVSNREQVQRDNVGADNRESSSGGQERYGGAASGEQDKAGERTPDSGGGTGTAAIDSKGQEPKPTKYVEAREAYDNATNNEERVKAGQKLSEVYAKLFGISENRVVVAESTAEFLDTMEMGMKQHLPNQVEREMEKAREYASKGNIIRGVTIGRAIILNTEHLPTAEKFTETWLHEQTHLADDRTFSKKERESIDVPNLDSHVPALYRKNKKTNKFSEAIAHAVQGLLKTHSIEQIAKGDINVEAIHEDIRDITLQTLNKLTNGNSYTDFARRNNENAHGSTKSSSRPVRRKKDTGNERRRPDGPDNADTRRTEPKQQPEVKSKEQQELEDLLKGLADDLGIEDVRFSVEEIASPSTAAIEKVLKINSLLVKQGKVGFEDYARVFINAMGDNIKPYLQGFYFLARGANPSVKGFNTLSEVEKIDLGKINRQEKASDQLPDTGKMVEAKPTEKQKETSKPTKDEYESFDTRGYTYVVVKDGAIVSRGSNPIMAKEPMPIKRWLDYAEKADGDLYIAPTSGQPIKLDDDQNRIFGYTFEQISDMQQRRPIANQHKIDMPENAVLYPRYEELYPQTNDQGSLLNNKEQDNDNTKQNEDSDASSKGDGTESGRLPKSEQVSDRGLSNESSKGASDSKQIDSGNSSSKSRDGFKYDVNKKYTNEEIAEVVSSVAEIKDGKVVITGEVTEDIKQLASHYKSGGVAKKDRGVLDEYYTDGKIVDATTQAMAPLLPKATGLKVLEPSVGTGNFLSAVPAGSDVNTFEINETTARIAKILNPNIEVNVRSFETEFIDDIGNKKPITEQYDIVIGNPPYGSHRGLYKGLGELPRVARYEDYFVKRSLDVMKDGGVLAMVLPSTWMDRHQRPDGYKIENAYRLPSGVFEGTQVGTDIVILRKEKGCKADSDHNYFETNPDKVLGIEKQRKNRFGKMETYVEGDIDNAVSRIKEDMAKAIIDEIGIEPTADNIREAGEVLDETATKEGAKAIIEEEQKAKKKPAPTKKQAPKKSKGKKQPLKITPSQLKYKLNNEDTQVPAAKQFDNAFTEAETAAFRDADYSGMLQNPEAHKEHANYIDGKWMHDFYYAEGNIYSRLEQLEKDKPNMDEAQYEKQKKMLKDVLPEQKTLDQINMTPNTAFVKNLVMGYGKPNSEGERKPITLQENFKEFINGLPYEAFGGSGKWEVTRYINNEQVTGSDKERNRLIRERRKEAGNRLFRKYLDEVLTDAEKRKVEYAFNREYNAVHRPDYSKVPMFSSINENFHGRPLKLTEVQLSGIGRMTVKGVGLLAHEVGFGKTLSGILSMHEAMERGFTKKPLLVVPNNSILEQWVQTIEQVIPQSTVNVLGNLGVKYDLTDFEVNDKDITIVTYEGFKKLGFSGETYDKMAQKFSYITEDLDTHKKKNVRDEAKEDASAEEVQGRMMRGGQYSFEGMGFDYMVFDEVHNANHIVSKVRIDRGQHSDFRSQEQRPSDLGIKTWLASQYIQEMNHGRNVLLLSATPFTNKPLEYYSILSLVANSTLERMGFFNVDQFFETFMEADSDFEIKADGTPVQKMNVRRFRNNGLFNQLIGEFIDIKGEEDNPSLVRPDRTNKEYKAPQNELFKQTMERVQVLLSDNDTLLKGLTDARQAAFSPFAASMAPRAPKDHKDFVKNSPKIDTTMRLVEQNLKDNPNGGQIIYSEVGIDFFPMIKEYAVKELKMKDSEVRILSGATSATERAKVQKGFNDGTIKLVIGSPAIKEGMNLQENTTDMYILSLPYNFTQLRQVEGRGWRQGNRWKNIRINFMLTDDSADVFLLQRLQIKQGLYNEAMKHDHETVDVGDIDTGELKTDLITDPKVRAKIEVDQIKAKLSSEKDQITSDLAFVTRKFEAYKEIEKEIKKEKQHLEWYKERAVEDPDSYWGKNLQKQEKKVEDTEAKLIVEAEKLEKQGVNIKEIEGQKTRAGAAITAIEKEIEQLGAREKELEKQYAEELRNKKYLDDSIIDKYVAERKKENQSGYYELREDSPLFHVQEQADAVLEFADRLMEPAPQRLWSKDLRQAEYEDRISYSRENGLWVASIDGKPIPNAISDDITRLKETLFGATQTEMDKWKAEYTAKQKGEGKKTTSIGDLIVVDASKQQNATQTSNNYIEMPVKLTTEEARMADISNKIKYSQENGLWVARIDGRPIKGASSESIHKLKSDLLDIDTSTKDYHQWRSEYSNEVGQKEAREALEQYEKEKDSPINYEPANILSEIILRPKASAQKLDWNSIGETYYVDKPAINIYNLHRSIYKIGNLLRPVRDLKQQGFLNFVGDTGYMNMDRVAEFSDKFEGAISNYAHMLMKTKHMATEAAQREIDLILREIDYAREYYKRLSQDESILREEREPLYHVEEKGYMDVNPEFEEVFKAETDRYKGEVYQIKGNNIETTLYTDIHSSENNSDNTYIGFDPNKAYNEIDRDSNAWNDYNASAMIEAHHLSIPQSLIEEYAYDEISEDYTIEDAILDGVLDEIIESEDIDTLKDKYGISSDMYDYASYQEYNETTDQLISDVQSELSKQFGGKVGKYTNLYVGENGEIKKNSTDIDGDSKSISIRIADHTHNPGNGRADVTIVIANKDQTRSRYWGASTDMVFDDSYSANDITKEVENFIKEKYSENKRKAASNSEENSIFAQNKDNGQANETRLDNRHSMEGSAKRIPLGEQRTSDAVYKTAEASELSGSTSAVQTIEEREELEARGLNPDWDVTEFRKSLIDNAKKNNIWFEQSHFSDKPKLHDSRAQGTKENDVYLNPDGKTLTKINNLAFVTGAEREHNLSSLLDRIAAHNTLFPEAVYTVKGFALNEQGRPSLVMEQPYIENAENATQEEIDSYLRDKGFELTGKRRWSAEKPVWSNGEYELYDARPANVLKDSKGELYFIDTIPHSVEYMEAENSDARYHMEEANHNMSLKDFGEHLKEKYPEVETLFLSESDNTISLDMIEVSKAQRKKGVGSSVMEELTDYADANGKEIELTPGVKDDRHGTTSRSRLVSFYKRFGFVENKGRNKDFSKKAGGMYRQPSGDVRFSVEERLYSNLDNIQDEVENYNDVISDVFNNSTQKSKILAAAKADGMKLKEAIENYIAEDATYDEVESVAKALNVGGMADGAVRYMFWRNANPNDGSMVWKAKDALKRRQFEDDILFDKDGPVRDSAMDEYEKKVRGARGLMKAGSWDAIKFGIEEGWMDRMASLRLLQNAIVGEGNPIPDGFNAYRLENQLSSRNLAQVEHYQEKYLDPMIKEANKLFGNDLKEIDRYLIAKHGLERNRYMAEEEIKRKSEPEIAELKRQLDNHKIDPDFFDERMDEIKERDAQKLEEYLISKDYSGLTALYEDIFGEEAEDVGEYTETVFNAMNQYVQDIENEKDTKPLWNSINKATKYMLKRQYDGGMMSKENYEKVRDMYENYVPLRGFDEVTGSDLYEYMTAKDSNYNRVLKKAHGRKSLSESPFVSLMSMGQSGIMEVNRNNMKKAFYRLVATNPSNIATIKDVWYVKSEDDTWTERHPQIPVDATGDEVASIVEAFEAEMKELFAEDKAKRGRNKLEAGARVTKAQESEHSVKVWVNGEEKVIYVNGNPRAAQALNGLTNSSMREKSGFKRTAQFLMRQMSANFTSRNPEFLITNAQRDMNYAITSAGIKEGPQYAARLGMNATKVGRTIAANIWGNGRKDSKYQKLWDEFVWNGGETGYAVLHSDDTNRKYINKQLRKFSNHKDIFLPFRVWAEQVENANRLIEANTRFAAYVTSREDGRTIERSIADAKDISVNFNRKGSGGYWASTIQDWILFSNPAIQSVRQMGGMAKNHTGRFALALSLAGLGGFMMPIINNLLISMFGDDGDDELYDNLTDWTKYNHMVMYVPGTKDKFISYALSHEMRGFHGLGVLAYEAANGQLRGRNGAQLVLEQFADNLPLDPTGGHSSFMFDAAKPLFEAYITNENFMGIPIYKDNPWNQNAPEWTKAYPRTSPALVDAAKWLNEATGGDEVVAGGININPARIEHVFKGYVGGAWSTYSDAISQVYGAVTGDEESQNIFNAPIARKLIKTSDKYVKERRINSEYRYWQDWMKEYERVQRGYMKIALDHEREDDREKYLQKYLGTFEETPTILYNRIKAISQVIESLEEAGSEQEALEMKAEITDLMWEMQKGD